MIPIVAGQAVLACSFRGVFLVRRGFVGSFFLVLRASVPTTSKHSYPTLTSTAQSAKQSSSHAPPAASKTTLWFSSPFLQVSWQFAFRFLDVTAQAFFVI